MSDEIGGLEAAALKRKERLAALRAAKESGGKKSDKPAFRSYKPATESLKDLVLPEPQLEEITDKVKEELETEDTGVVMQSLDFTNLAPRKADWDLKRDIAPKLEKLEKRTQKAIAELIRQRLKEEDLANAVAAGSHLELDQDED